MGEMICGLGSGRLKNQNRQRRIRNNDKCYKNICKNIKEKYNIVTKLLLASFLFVLTLCSRSKTSNDSVLLLTVMFSTKARGGELKFDF